MSEKAPFVLTSIYARSDKGSVRENNEDNFIVADILTGKSYSAPQSIERSLERNLLLLAVSDGMGGASAGEIASAVTVYSLKAELIRLSAVGNSVDRLTEAVKQVNNVVLRLGESCQELKGMGATLTAVLIEGARAYIAEVGDSRAYIIRQGRIKQVTVDQSLYAMLAETEGYKGKQMPAATSKNVLLQSLGGQPSVQVALSTVELRAGDHLLLCSDGLSNKLENDEIRKLVERSPNLEAACRTMIDVAKRRGGEDNVTVILARFDGTGLRVGSRASLNQTIDMLALFDPMSDRPDRSTRPLVSEQGEGEEFVSTVGMLPHRGNYEGRDKLLDAGQRVSRLLAESRKACNELCMELKLLEAWLQECGEYDAELRRVLAHLEYTNRRLHTAESFAKRYNALIDRLSKVSMP
ncbi:MAG: protein phosphatase 2C domain-containing protein [Acidobacteriota bacterium]|nr:protein phosphatase 2C domain-containing protein [Blastocatellia bacterium]MDW8413149.1 protein phosphatase 2C domain-containing protein [Acidobacteriota bacterium]